MGENLLCEKCILKQQALYCMIKEALNDSTSLPEFEHRLDEIGFMVDALEFAEHSQPPSSIEPPAHLFVSTKLGAAKENS